ncbi:hypothetical protein PUN28_001875 [Cardiocondyla obscurior]|uniref:Uncharacterized protein n=1 Tax=Cardiocondyla obscurior TaxID=286306 RepID=A0AAW2GRQ9_9HYME
MNRVASIAVVKCYCAKEVASIFKVKKKKKKKLNRIKNLNKCNILTTIYLSYRKVACTHTFKSDGDDRNCEKLLSEEATTSKKKKIIFFFFFFFTFIVLCFVTSLQMQTLFFIYN